MYAGLSSRRGCSGDEQLRLAFVTVVSVAQEEFDKDLIPLEETFKPLVLKCKELGRAMRIGTNHGSLSARVLSFYGDTPRGMVESAVEFANICRCVLCRFECAFDAIAPSFLHVLCCGDSVGIEKLPTSCSFPSPLPLHFPSTRLRVTSANTTTTTSCSP